MRPLLPIYLLFAGLFLEIIGCEQHQPCSCQGVLFPITGSCEAVQCFPNGNGFCINQGFGPVQFYNGWNQGCDPQTTAIRIGSTNYSFYKASWPDLVCFCTDSSCGTQFCIGGGLNYCFSAPAPVFYSSCGLNVSANLLFFCPD